MTMMGVQKMSGTHLSCLLKQQLQNRAVAFKKKVAFAPGLRVVLWGDNPASLLYIKHKKKCAESLGIHFGCFALDSNTTEEEVKTVVEGLNEDPNAHGIIVQLPLYNNVAPQNILKTIEPRKDVDGLTPFNAGLLYSSYAQSGFVSCTPWGCLQLLKAYNVSLEGKHVVVMGRSSLVGRPFAALCLKENATVTLVHSHTPNVEKYTRQADVLCVAIGKPKTVGAQYIKEGAVVLDVGIHQQGDTWCGDVDAKAVKAYAKLLSPVPGGVGPMTVMGLMYNTLKAAYQQHGLPFEDISVRAIDNCSDI